MTPTTTRVHGTHVLFVVHLLVFLILVVGASAPWYPTALETFGLGDARGLLTRPWTLVTHALLHRHPVEFMLSAALLLLAGPPVEQRLGTRFTLVLLLLATVLTGLCHVGLQAAGVVEGRLFTGAVGMSAALLTAYLLLLGGERRIGSLPFPFCYLAASVALCALVMVLDREHQRSLGEEVRTLREAALRGESLGPEERLDRLATAAQLERHRADFSAHLLGLVTGGLALGGCRVLGLVGRRVRVLREIRELQEEVDARARVEELLAKISRDGIESLSRHERRFLTYASQRFYRSGRMSQAT